MKLAPLFLLCTAPLWCQSFSFGVKGGVPLGEALSDNGDARDLIGTERWTIGPTVELSLPLNLSIGVDALYRRFSSAFLSAEAVTYFNNAKIGHWEFPVYAKYRFGGHVVRPYVEAGFAFDNARTSGTSGCTGGEFAPGEPICGSAPASSTYSSSQWGVGVMVGGGVEIKAAFLKIAPEVRYTRWQKGVFSDLSVLNSPIVATSQPNQAEVLVGIRF